MIPTSAYFVVRRNESDGTILFIEHMVKIGKRMETRWTLPGGMRRRRYGSYTDFAQTALEPIYDGLSIVSLRLIMVTKGKMFIGFIRTRCSIFECKVIGVERENAPQKYCFMKPEDIPSHILSPDVSGLIPLLISQSRPA